VDPLLPLRRSCSPKYSIKFMLIGNFGEYLGENQLISAGSGDSILQD
jgi:hypothetical protein